MMPGSRGRQAFRSPGDVMEHFKDVKHAAEAKLKRRVLWLGIAAAAALTCFVVGAPTWLASAAIVAAVVLVVPCALILIKHKADVEGLGKVMGQVKQQR